MKITSSIKLICLICSCFVSRDVLSESVSKYADQQTREIKSLSPADILELKRGGGWGFAKPAELNGLPGPSHVLEMKKHLYLNEKQVSEITVIFKGMKVQAIHASEKYLSAEQHLDSFFKSGTMSKTKLQKLLEISSIARRELRYIHLFAHIETSHLLNNHQIQLYNLARGYTGSGKCKETSEDHSAGLDRKNNKCH